MLLASYSSSRLRSLTAAAGLRMAAAASLLSLSSNLQKNAAHKTKCHLKAICCSGHSFSSALLDGHPPASCSSEAVEAISDPGTTYKLVQKGRSSNGLLASVEAAASAVAATQSCFCCSVCGPYKNRLKGKPSIFNLRKVELLWMKEVCPHILIVLSFHFPIYS